MQFLLDTNVISEIVRNPDGHAARRAIRAGSQNLCTSIIVAGEVRYGLAKKRSERLLRQLDEIFVGLPILPLEKPADEIYGELRARLERQGRLIGPNDLLVAAHVLALDCTLITDNEGEFSRIDGLALENWLR